MDTTFDIKGLNFSAAWDEQKRTLTVREFGGEISMRKRLMGRDIDLCGLVGAAPGNKVLVTVTKLSGMPPFLLPVTLKMAALLGLVPTGALQARGKEILLNPEKFFPSGQKVRLIFQPEEKNKSLQSEASFRQRILTWAEKKTGFYGREAVDYLLTLPDLLAFLANLAKDPRVPTQLKLRVVLCIAYVISPVDLIPEVAVNLLGYSDDLLAMLLVAFDLAAKVPPEVIRENWPGRRDVLEFILKGHAALPMVRRLPALVWQKMASVFTGLKNRTTAING